MDGTPNAVVVSELTSSELTPREARARDRDLAALARDEAADARDLVIARHEAACELDDVAYPPVRGGAISIRAGELRALTLEHVELAANDRRIAALERHDAAAECEALARLLAIAETDALTGARTRAAGLLELERELVRAGRTESLLAVAYVDIVGLKRRNDTQGHAAGDELLKRVVVGIRAHLRPYDLIVRVGGDEFVCAMPAMSLDHARRRFGRIAAALADGPDQAAIRIGFAQLSPADTAATLIARADDELYRERRVTRGVAEAASRA